MQLQPVLGCTYKFYNIIFNMKHRLYIASGSAFPRKNSGCTPGREECGRNLRRKKRRRSGKPERGLAA
jgi:hypothetical protein